MRSFLRGAIILMAVAAVRASPPAAPPETFVIPVAGASMRGLHSEFNAGRGNHRHRALDILAPRGTPVLAAVDGSIRKLLTSKAGGLTIYEFDERRTMVYYYAHLDHYAAGIGEGMKVQKGDVIGYVGTTGNAPPDTPHLHFAIARLPPSKKWWRGRPVDPYPLLRDYGVTVEADRTGTAGR